jgi:hypothetical protein
MEWLTGYPGKSAPLQEDKQDLKQRGEDILSKLPLPQSKQTFGDWIAEQKAKNPEAKDIHYGGRDNPFEPSKIIHFYDFNFNKGNILKYLCRAGHKAGADEKEDLYKIINYARKEIERLVEYGRRNK